MDAEVVNLDTAIADTLIRLAGLLQRRARQREVPSPPQGQPHWVDALDAWMRAKGLSQSDVARLVPCGSSSVSFWLNNRVPPGGHYRQLIERASDGAVPAHLPPRSRGMGRKPRT